MGELTNCLAFDTLGTTIPLDKVLDLRKFLWENGKKYSVSDEEIEKLQRYCKMDKGSDEFMHYAKVSGPIFEKMVVDRDVHVPLYDDVAPAFDLTKDLGYSLRILTKGTKGFVLAIYDVNDLLELIGGERITSTTDGVKQEKKTEPDCYREFQDSVLIPNGETLLSYTSDDSRETNACREAFEGNKVDVWFIDRGQVKGSDLASGVRVSDSLVKIVKNYEAK